MDPSVSFEEVAHAYEPLIKKCIRQWHLQKGYDDMYQTALIALWEAFVKFDPKKGYFPSYAEAYIRGRLRNEMTRERKYTEHHLMNSDLLMNKGKNLLNKDLLENITFLELLKDLTIREKLWVQRAIVEGWKTLDIACSEGVSQHTVRSWKKSAIKKLKASSF